jgi:hypothetical protein
VIYKKPDEAAELMAFAVHADKRFPPRARLGIEERSKR